MVILYRWNRSALQFQVELRVSLNWSKYTAFLKWPWMNLSVLSLITQVSKVLLKTVFIVYQPSAVKPKHSSNSMTCIDICLYIYICMHEQHKPTDMCSGGAQSNEYVRACIYTFTYWRKYLSIEERCNWCAITSIRCRLMHTNTQILYLTKI